MASPIFVIGKNRSGTKWLSNVIANHKDVACIQHELFGGIL
ncbi:sulfotransferase [candidate division WOR-3 bacterium]|nr:sulfotransferase [candidate division WOR-3 bacterium]